MYGRRIPLILITLCLLASARAQESQATPTTPTFKAETKLVLVDAVVTDKKGKYVDDLEQKDFKIWEDGKEQPLTSFSLEKHDVSSATGAPRYMVLFFDNSSMAMGDQAKARDAALKFLDANAAPGRMIAVVDFGGTVRISQNFTAVPDRLKQAVKNMQNSFVGSNEEAASMTAGSSAMSSLSGVESDFEIHTVLLAVLNVARSLAVVPGRKTLVLLTSGFPLNFEYEAEVAATIAACNKANVAVYPIDVRGLTVDFPTQHSLLERPSDAGSPRLIPAGYNGNVSAYLRPAVLTRPYGFFDPQKGGTGGGHPPATGGGGAPTGGPGVTRPTGGVGVGALSPYAYNTRTMPPAVIVPEFPKSASDNQQVMYQIADGTGGFVIVNSNDFVSGMARIAADQTQYYLLGYKPPESSNGKCHTIKVKVDRGGTEVRARSGYCEVKPLDALAGTPVGKDLESQVKAASLEGAGAVMKAPFFYTSANTARVDLAVDIPVKALNFDKDKGRQHATVNILGIAQKPDGSVAARFSDSVDVDLADKKQFEEFQKLPFHYENQFEVASGKYTLTVVFSSGNQRFGKLEMPLVVDPFQEKQFSISGVALSNDIREVADAQLGIDSQLLEDKTPLLVQGLQVLPSASNRFKKTDTAAIYAEIYEPLLKDPKPPQVAYELFIRDSKTGAEKLHIGEEIKKVRPGNPVIPFAVRLPVSTLPPGEYHVELRAVDSAGNESPTRKADFQVE